MSNREQLKQYLSRSGHSLTGPRVAVFESLRRAGSIRPKILITGLRDKIDRATIYRTMDLFKRLGIMHEIISGGQKLVELTDAFEEHHHHLACLNCGRSQVITDAGIERQLEQVAKRYGFRASQHQVEISGVCSECGDRSQETGVRSVRGREG